MKNRLFILFVGILLSTSFVIGQDQTINNNLTIIGDVLMRSEQIPVPFGEWGKRLQFGQENNDPIFLSRVNIYNGHSELRLVLGDDGSEKLTLGFNYFEDKLWRERIVFRANGFVGIKVSDPTCELDVNGRIKGNTLDINELIRAKEVKIQIPDWSDFVFSPDYKLPSLSEVEKHIKEKQHLPDIPSEKEVIENGISVGEMQAKLLQKTEELTLYVIEQDKQIKEMKEKNIEQKEESKALKVELSQLKQQLNR